MSAPIVVILAAGQGTRMHSRRPKVLHELCGRPMVLWPVYAALEAGAETVVVVDSPARALEAILPEGVKLAVQQTPNGLGKGVFWWEPMAAGAIVKRGMFDDQHNALPVLRVTDPATEPPIP